MNKGEQKFRRRNSKLESTSYTLNWKSIFLFQLIKTLLNCRQVSLYLELDKEDLQQKICLVKIYAHCVNIYSDKWIYKLEFVIHKQEHFD